MDKNEAMKRLDAIEAEAKELRRIIEGPEVDPREWVGKWGFFSDIKKECPNDGTLRRLVNYTHGAVSPFRVDGNNWRYFRPATAEELGFAPEIKPDWSKAPEWAKWWAKDPNGAAYWYCDKPSDAMVPGFMALGKCQADRTAIPNWRDTLTKRPE